MAFGDLQFAQDDARVLADRLRQLYEAIRRANGEPGYRLALGAPERLIQLTDAAILAEVNHDIDYTGKSNLLYFADEDSIEHLGYLYGERGKRLPASYAITTVRFTLSAERGSSTPIPMGTRVTPDNQMFFETTRFAEIPAGSMSVDVEARCQTAGTAGNGLDVGYISNIVDRVPFVIKAENITPTSGGADVESLEDYRARLRNVPESFSVAGPDGAYEFWARSANPGIVDARVWMPDLDMDSFALFLEPWGVTNAAGFYEALNDYYRESGTGPGNVNVAVLMRDGELPSDDVLSQVYGVLSDRTRRPLTDFVHVIKPSAVEFSVSVRYWIAKDDGASVTNIITLVEHAVDDYIAWQTSRLGADIVPDRLHKAIMACGVKRLEMISPTFTVLRPWEVAQFNGDREIMYMGLEDA